MSSFWVINASPLIVLSRIGQLDLLERLSAKAGVPDAVIGEVQAGLANDPSAAITMQWASQRRLANLPVPESVAIWELGIGEHRKEKADEDRYFAEQDRKLIEQLHRQHHPAQVADKPPPESTTTESAET